MSSFSIWCLKRHLPLVDDVVAVHFLAVIPRDLARKGGSWIEWFRIFVDVMVKSPFETTRTLPEFYRVFLFGIEETMQLAKNGCGVRLIWVWFAIEDFLCSMDGIGDNNDFWHVFFNVGLVDATSNSEQLCLYTCDKHYVMNCFDKRSIGWVYVRYRCSNVILNASICYN